jgi:glycosyltransferase involved in cell wall biosynthesis
VSTPELSVRKKKIIVVMPAYNAAETVQETYERIPKEFRDEIILVDDASRDETFDRAKSLGVNAIRHRHNLGYGGNQKTCYTEALKHEADIVVMIHPDGQYDPAFLGAITEPLLSDTADVVLGSRMYYRKQALAGGMPKYKFVSNIFLTTIENFVLRKNLSEYHTGYRAYSRHFLETIPFMRNSNGFVFDTEVLVQAAHFGMRIKEVPVSTRYFKEASSVSFKGSVVYGTLTLFTLLKYLLHRFRIYKCRLFLP